MEGGRAGPDAGPGAPLSTMTSNGGRAGGDVIEQVRRGVRGLRWYWRGVTGADAYERYVAHLRRHHPGCEVPTERQFWKDKYAEQESNPKTRCC